jgi:invasion protein IalB
MRDTVKSAKRLLAACAAAAMALTPAAATAQETEAQTKQFGPRVQKEGKAALPGTKQPSAEVVATHGAWSIECETPPPQEGAAVAPKKQCGMVQTSFSEKNKKIGIKLVIVRGKQDGKDVTKLRVMAPIGVYLPTGVALEIDGAAVSRVPFTLCIPSSCIALADAQQKTLDKLKKGTKANFIVYFGPGADFPISVSLEGFSAALGALAEL